MSFRNKDFDLNCPSESFPNFKPFSGSKLIPNENETNRNRTQSSSSGSYWPFDSERLSQAANRSFSEPPEDRTQSDASSSSQAQTVRHIPIFVESRNETIINQGGSQPDKIFGEEKVNFPGTETNMGNSMSDNVPRPSPNFEKQSQKFPHQAQKPYQQQSPQRFTKPAETSRSRHEQQSQPQPQTKPKTSEEKISAVLKNVSDLNRQVVVFDGKKGDKTYLFLDEMFTRNLLLLDDIDSEGKDSVRKFRKEAIESVQRSINSLEKKAESNQSADKNEALNVQLSLEEHIKKIEDIMNRIGEKSTSGLGESAKNAKSETGGGSENQETRAVLVTEQQNVDETAATSVENRAVLVTEPDPQPSAASPLPDHDEQPSVH